MDRLFDIGHSGSSCLPWDLVRAALEAAFTVFIIARMRRKRKIMLLSLFDVYVLRVLCVRMPEHCPLDAFEVEGTMVVDIKSKNG